VNEIIIFFFYKIFLAPN